MVLPSAGLVLALFLVAAILITFRWRRSYLVVNPLYFDHLKRLALDDPDAILELPAVIVSGHLDRNVASIDLGNGNDKVRAFLKREHQIRLKVRLLNAISGFGFVSKSHREAVILRRAQEAGIHCPEWIAFGQTRKGQAFVLVAALDPCVDLRTWLTKSSTSTGRSRELAIVLGRKLAQIHNAGFVHPDLYAKHVLVDEESGDFCFLDWQRSQRSPQVNWNQRYRDLAALHATLPEDATLSKDRTTCLFAYLRETRKQNAFAVPTLRVAAEGIQKQAAQLLKRRHVRQARQAILTQVSQNVIWLNGEGLCVTPEFLEKAKKAPESLGFSSLDYRPNGLERKEIEFGAGYSATLTCRQENRPISWLKDQLLGRKWTSPEVRQAGLLFRLQRLGILTPRLLAFGQTNRALGTVNSFILTESPKNQAPPSLCPTPHASSIIEQLHLRDYRALIRKTAVLLKRMHDAGCHFKEPMEMNADFVVIRLPEFTVGLGRMDNIVLQRGNRRMQQKRDLIWLSGGQASLVTSRSDVIRLLRAYLGVRRLGAEGKALALCLFRHSLRHPRSTLFQQRHLHSLLASNLRLAGRMSA
jgi:tRNA A-37 threonylcarbamoyl transferase component Bud32